MLFLITVGSQPLLVRSLMRSISSLASNPSDSQTFVLYWSLLMKILVVHVCIVTIFILLTVIVSVVVNAFRTTEREKEFNLPFDVFIPSLTRLQGIGGSKDNRN
jgi:flagellar biosynthesis protein FlhB